MSTRCQVQVVQEGCGWEEKVTLYHHTDGYPEYMIPIINKAYNYTEQYSWDNEPSFCGWQKGRAGKVASLLCWSDPMVFEPEEGHDLHGDIEYFYRLYCVNDKGGSMATKARWEVEIFVPGGGFWDNADMSNMKVLEKRQSLETLMEKYATE